MPLHAEVLGKMVPGVECLAALLLPVVSIVWRCAFCIIQLDRLVAYRLLEGTVLWAAGKAGRVPSAGYQGRLVEGAIRFVTGLAGWRGGHPPRHWIGWLNVLSAVLLDKLFAKGAILIVLDKLVECSVRIVTGQRLVAEGAIRIGRHLLFITK